MIMARRSARSLYSLLVAPDRKPVTAERRARRPEPPVAPESMPVSIKTGIKHLVEVASA